MATTKSAAQINARFQAEQEYIGRYVRYLHAKSTIHDRKVLDLNRILRRVQVRPLPTRRYDRTREPYSSEEYARLLESLHTTGREVYQTILGHEQRLDDVPSLGLDGPAGGYLDHLEQWVDYFLDRLSDDPEDEEVNVAIRDAMREAEAADQDLDEEDRIPRDALRVLLTTAVDHALHFKVVERIDALEYALEQFEEIELLARVATPDAEINVLRQGFILLMTAFDAAIFDLVRVALRKHFFLLIGSFGKQEKMSLQEIAQAGSCEALQEQIIEEQLKKRYIKDLLFLLASDWKVECVDTAVGDKFERLIEFVLRRNIHVHNRGIVDERYLDEEKNLDGLTLGGVARIDEPYWALANRLCEQCVERVAAWAKT